MHWIFRREDSFSYLGGDPVEEHDERKAHTGEHILFRALSMVFEGLSVKKVELGNRNYFVIRYDRDITWDGILQAEQHANRIIDEGRPVITYRGTKVDVSTRFPRLRVRWDRITEDEITVVCVEDFDWAACSGHHVSNTREIDYILVTRITSLGKGVHEIEFTVGEQAKREALHRSALCMKIVETLKTSLDHALPTISNLLTQRESLTEQVRMLTWNCVNHITPLHIQNLTVFCEDLTGSDRKTLQKAAAQLTREGENLVVLFDQSDGTFAVAACSPAVGVDCRELIQHMLPGNKGGGKAEYALAYSPLSVEHASLLSSIRQYLEREEQE
jgi:alanyl-tRNA synthetase